MVDLDKDSNGSDDLDDLDDSNDEGASQRREKETKYYVNKSANEQFLINNAQIT
jgi:hypothetical protein